MHYDVIRNPLSGVKMLAPAAKNGKNGKIKGVYKNPPKGRGGQQIFAQVDV